MMTNADAVLVRFAATRLTRRFLRRVAKVISIICSGRLRMRVLTYSKTQTVGSYTSNRAARICSPVDFVGSMKKDLRFAETIATTSASSMNPSPRAVKYSLAPTNSSKRIAVHDSNSGITAPLNNRLLTASFQNALPQQEEIIVADRRRGGETEIGNRDLRVESPIHFCAILICELRTKFASLTMTDRLTPRG